MLAGQVAAPDQVPDDHRAGRIALGAERGRRGDFLHVLGDAKHECPCSGIWAYSTAARLRQRLDVSQSPLRANEAVFRVHRRPPASWRQRKPLRYTRPLVNDPSNAQNTSPTSEPALPGRWAAALEPPTGRRRKNSGLARNRPRSTRLQFAAGLVARHRPPPARPRHPATGDLAGMAAAAGLTLNHHDHAGVGALELVDENGRLACLALHAEPGTSPRCASSANSTCIRDSIVSGQPVLRSTEDYLPEMQGADSAGRRRMSDLHPRSHRQPRRPGRCSASGALPAPTAGNCFLGFLLTLASTAATNWCRPT